MSHACEVAQRDYDGMNKAVSSQLYPHEQPTNVSSGVQSQFVHELKFFASSPQSNFAVLENDGSGTTPLGCVRGNNPPHHDGFRLTNW